MSITKNQDWQIKFDEFMFKNKDKDFAWGTWDCCIFSNACLKAMTGKDVIPKELNWNNEPEAKKSIKKYGNTLNKSIAKACKKVGMYEVPKAYIQKGDLVVYKEESELVGMSDGIKMMTPSKEGLSRKQDVNIVSVWRVPNG